MHIGIVANEPSGDLLGAALLRELRTRHPGIRFSGVAGPRMLAEGGTTLFDLERLTVMGLVEVLAHLPELQRLRRVLACHFLAERPDVFIGIDAPDFNLGLERRLRRAGIPTVHLVSPTVWAWRPGRVKGLRQAADLVLSLFPFEEPFLRAHGVPVRYIGHPLADALPLVPDRDAARAALGLSPTAPVMALLPGSRRGEVSALAQSFLETAAWCRVRRPELQFAVPLISPRIRQIFTETQGRMAPELPVALFDGCSREVLTAANCVLVASGTATLETLLCKRPMVVAYRIHALTYYLVKALKLVKVPHVAMANLLAESELAPEFLQDQVRAENLGPALLDFLDHPQKIADIECRYARIHRLLRRHASREAAEAVLDLIARRGA